jgi:hypothetical protein
MSTFPSMAALSSLYAQPSVFDCHKLLNEFHERHVRLGQDLRHDLAGYRNANLDRLSSGLEALGPIRGADTADFDDHLNQGSYAMHTLNQHPDNDYDIDSGVVFLQATIPDGAKEARARVARALRSAGGNFSKPPEARTNAVTVWYADGHHVDLAIYRRTSFGLEHAGGDTWNACDPEAIPVWFRERDAALSPANLPHQFRRVVRWLKAFARSRQSWNTPGGMIISALAAEVFRPHPSRDDVALLDTITALSNRLNTHTYVANPVGGTLTGKQKYLDRVVVLRDKLTWLLPKLADLREASCTADDAMRAWRWMFRHAFWETPSGRTMVMADSISSTTVVRVRADVASEKYGKPVREYREGYPLPKGCWLQFRAENLSLGAGDSIHWIVENTGSEAFGEDDLGHVTRNRSTTQWEHTAYTGTHRMICEVRSGRRVVARGIQNVTIS